MIPIDINEIFESTLAEVTSDEGLIDTVKLISKLVDLSPEFLVHMTCLSVAQASLPSNEAVIYQARNAYIAYVTYVICRIKMLNSLEPSLN